MSTFDAAGWTVATCGDGKETYTKKIGLARVVAEWDPIASLGSITVEDILGTRHVTGIDTFRDAPTFWIAANLAADTAAAPLPVAGHVIGAIKADPGDSLEADLDLTIDDGREISLTLIDRQAYDLISELSKIDNYVWQEELEEEEDDPYEGPDHGNYTEVLPQVTAAETLALVDVLTNQFGIDRRAIAVSGGGAWIAVSGDDVVTGILRREQEFDTAIGAKWRFATRDAGEPCLTIQYHPKGQYQRSR
ncbi:hypothetical protein SAXI111661_05835 [Saccharomonospora xinjiangensis]|uniref:hypothetical protein n=1 Tax=Saccharomonospora xinjiangensis TaxID=75294 RepID=UPI0010704DCB|nr:hypothetical protein [Saccharomonospora xinjiangensis]QBQ58777.1 hypothetical protein EYD13_01955 [Saccharomonospora xinjiangensis]